MTPQLTEWIADDRGISFPPPCSVTPSVLKIGLDFMPHPMDFLGPNIILDGSQFPAPEQTPLQAVA